MFGASALSRALVERGHLLGDPLSQQRRHGVADLALDGAEAHGEGEFVGIGEQPAQLSDVEASVLPVERPDVAHCSEQQRRETLAEISRPPT